MVDEVGELELGDGLPNRELRESDPLRRLPWLSLYRVRGQVTYKEEGSPNQGVMSWRKGA
jgi:hypothetical protein